MSPRTDVSMGELVEAYERGESASSIARRLRCSVWVVLARLRNVGINIRSSAEQGARFLGDRAHPANPDIVQQVVDGLLLGDGHLDRKGCLRLEQSVVRAGWLEHVHELLQRHGCQTTLIDIPAKEKVYEGRVIHGGAAQLLYSVCYTEFKAQRQRWYPEDAKRIPQDVTLTPLSLAYWICGDGTHAKRGSLTLFTNSFTSNDVQFLSSCLRRDFAVTPMVRKNGRGEFVLDLNKVEEVFHVAEVVRPWMPECCLYKIQYARHQKPNPHWYRSRKLTREAVVQIRKAATEGATLLSLARDHGISVSAVSHVVRGRTYREV